MFVLIDAISSFGLEELCSKWAKYQDDIWTFDLNKIQLNETPTAVEISLGPNQLVSNLISCFLPMDPQLEHLTISESRLDSVGFSIDQGSRLKTLTILRLRKHIGRFHHSINIRVEKLKVTRIVCKQQDS